jgi:hypothetical protein
MNQALAGGLDALARLTEAVIGWLPLSFKPQGTRTVNDIVAGLCNKMT